MKFSRPTREPVTSGGLYSICLFNVLLILLVFFMLSPSLTLPSGLSVALPRVLSSEPISKDGCVVTLLKNDAIYLGARPVTLEELRRFVSLQKSAELQVLIKADRNGRIDTLVRIWDLLRQAGVARVSMATNE